MGSCVLASACHIRTRSLGMSAALWLNSLLLDSRFCRCSSTNRPQTRPRGRCPPGARPTPKPLRLPQG